MKAGDAANNNAGCCLRQKPAYQSLRSPRLCETNALLAKACPERYLVSKVNTPSQSSPGGSLRKYMMRSTYIW